jgi:hypothetical protein
LEVSNVEILEQARAIADLSGAGDRFWQRILSSQAHQATIANDLLTDKILQRLAAIAKGEAPEPGEEAETGEATEDEPQAPVDESQTQDEVTELPESAEDSDLPQATAAENESEAEATEESVTEKA